MAENRRGKEQRFYFSRAQLVLLGAAFVLASIIIFFLGVFVGKGIEERRIVKNEEPSIKIPVRPSSQGSSSGAQAAQVKEELTFYETLPKSAAPSAVDDKPNEIQPPEKVAKLNVKGDKPPAKEAAPPAPKRLEKKVEKPALQAEAPQKNQLADPVERHENGKNWTVQVNAVPDERAAKVWVDRLRSKGYNAYMTEVNDKGKLWYRVRVGRYGTREEADKMVDSLKTKENLAAVFATSR
jgi:cell division septation protein DedD